MQEIIVKAKEGYKLDFNQETGTISIVKVEPEPDQKPKWEDFGGIEGYYVSGGSVEMQWQKGKADDWGKCVWPTKAEAEAALALSQLAQWRNKYNGFVLDESNIHQCNYRIRPSNGILVADFTYQPVLSKILLFKDQETAEKFLNDFEDLIETAKPLL